MQIQDLIIKHPSDFCLICGGAPAIVGIFQPEESGAWGGMKGKARFFRYCLCVDCLNLPDKEERVEKIIRHELTTGKLNHED